MTTPDRTPEELAQTIRNYCFYDTVDGMQSALVAVDALLSLVEKQAELQPYTHYAHLVDCASGSIMVQDVADCDCGLAATLASRGDADG